MVKKNKSRFGKHVVTVPKKENLVVRISKEEIAAIKQKINSENFEESTDESSLNTSYISSSFTDCGELEQYLTDRFDFKLNKIKGIAHYSKKGEDQYCDVDDLFINSVLRDVHKAAIKASKSDVRNLIYSDFSLPFLPFEDYFYSLPEWKQSDTDYILQLARTVTVSGDVDRFWTDWFKKWLVAAVGCALDVKITNHTVLVLVGRQSVGKTRWLEALVPEKLKEYYFSGTVNPGNKDSIIQISECFLINMDELGSFRTSKIEEFKELITKSSVNIRRPYGFRAEAMPRRASFMGSVNDTRFLNDPTGSRRFLCFEVSKIDNEHNIDIDSVWAQALSLYKSGFRYWFNDEEVAEVLEHNDRFNITSIEEEVVQSMFIPCQGNEKADISLPTARLLDYIIKKNPLGGKLSVAKLGRALQSSGFEPRKSNGRQLYDLKFRVQ